MYIIPQYFACSPRVSTSMFNHAVIFLKNYITGITLAQNFLATSRLRPGDLERCFNKQGDTRLHVAAVRTR